MYACMFVSFHNSLTQDPLKLHHIALMDNLPSRGFFLTSFTAQENCKQSVSSVANLLYCFQEHFPSIFNFVLNSKELTIFHHAYCINFTVMFTKHIA